MPAAATITVPVPFAHAAVAAAAIVGSLVVPPSDIEITSTPLDASQVTQLATPANVPEPLASSPRQIASLALNATPATPTPLFAFPATVPATCVPWPWPSAHSPSTTWSDALTAAQAVTLPARSSWLASMPVSTIPTVAPPSAGNAPSPAASQPSGASMSASFALFSP